MRLVALVGTRLAGRAKKRISMCRCGRQGSGGDIHVATRSQRELQAAFSPILLLLLFKLSHFQIMIGIQKRILAYFY